MTLLDRICCALLPCALVFSLLSCEDPSEVGLSLNSDGTQIGVFVEELVLPATNVFIDSLRTDGDRRLLVGKYDDQVFGSTESSAFTQLSLTRFTFETRDSDKTTDGKNIFDYEIDSVILQLRYNYFHSDNFAQDQRIMVKQINDTLFSNVFYLSQFPSITDEDSKLYGEKTFQIDPEVDSLLKINLDFFGEATLEYLRNTTVSSISGDSIRNQLKGIALVPDPNNSALIGFDPTHPDSKLSVYYQIKQVEDVTEPTTITDSLSIDFNLAAGVRFNSISTDRASSSLSVADENLKVFDLEDGKVYLQSGTGIYPRIDISPLKQFLEEQGNIIINRTDIEIPISDEIINPTYVNHVADTRFFFIDEGTNIRNSSGSAVLTNLSYLSSQTNIPATAVAAEGETTLEAETTLFTQLINSNDIDVDKLVLIPTDATSMNQSIFDKSGIKMKVYYTVPK